MKQKDMKKIGIILLSMISMAVYAQQLPDSGFENWTAEFNKDAQLVDWHGSNVQQIGLKFTFMYQRDGRTGKCAYVADKEVGAIGITAVGPGYISLGTPWQYMNGLSIKSATAGTYGGIKWTARPDTMSVWIKRTGDNTDKEDFHLLFYSWTGTAKGTKYKNKVGGCTEVERINEESDIRQALDGNECGTDVPGKQVCEGWVRARAKYDNWTQIKVPIFYMSDAKPQMCNVIFSAGNYPAFRANDGLYDGNALYVDDVELIYSAKIDNLVVGGVEWKSFNPNTTQVQTFRLENNVNQVPEIEAFRGVGSLTNIKGKKVNFPGRRLGEHEITIQKGAVNGAPTVITVKSEDGKSTQVYKIKFVH